MKDSYHRLLQKVVILSIHRAFLKMKKKLKTNFSFSSREGNLENQDLKLNFLRFSAQIRL